MAFHSACHDESGFLAGRFNHAFLVVGQNKGPAAGPRNRKGSQVVIRIADSDRVVLGREIYGALLGDHHHCPPTHRNQLHFAAQYSLQIGSVLAGRLLPGTYQAAIHAAIFGLFHFHIQVGGAPIRTVGCQRGKEHDVILGLAALWG